MPSFIKDLYKALISSIFYFRREYKRRVQATQKRAMPDPLKEQE